MAIDGVAQIMTIDKMRANTANQSNIVKVGVTQGKKRLVVSVGITGRLMTIMNWQIGTQIEVSFLPETEELALSRKQGGYVLYPRTSSSSTSYSKNPYQGSTLRFSAPNQWNLIKMNSINCPARVDGHSLHIGISEILPKTKHKPEKIMNVSAPASDDPDWVKISQPEVMPRTKIDASLSCAVVKSDSGNHKGFVWSFFLSKGFAKSCGFNGGDRISMYHSKSTGLVKIKKTEEGYKLCHRSSGNVFEVRFPVPNEWYKKNPSNRKRAACLSPSIEGGEILFILPDFEGGKDENS